MPAPFYNRRMSRLTLHYAPEDEWHGRVSASVVSSDYAGRSSGWFSVDQLRAFCAALEAYPISPDAPVLLGGFWKEEGIDQAHIRLSVSGYDPQGGLVVAVRLAKPIWKSEVHDLHHAVVTHFRTDYPSLDRFRASLLALIDGRTAVAELDGL